jgi:molecular chaperone DnaK
MVSDAEKNRAEDEARRKVVTAKNELDGLYYSVEKTLKENADKIDAAAKSEVESALTEAKSALEGSDAEKMRSSTERLQKASAKMAEQLYKQSSGGNTDGGTGSSGGGSSGENTDGEKKKDGKDDDVIDADFKEV